MAYFPHRCCHRCSVTDYQIHPHRLYYTIAYHPQIIHITIVKINAAIIHLRVSLLLFLDWVCHSGNFRQHKELKKKLNKPRGLNERAGALWQTLKTNAQPPTSTPRQHPSAQPPNVCKTENERAQIRKRYNWQRVKEKGRKTRDSCTCISISSSHNRISTNFSV
jgi:hypothetical protein